LTPGQQHEATVAETLIEHVCGAACIADAGYDAGAIRTKARQRGMRPVIPSHPTRKKKHRLNKKLYALRYKIECCFHSLKRFRAVATRYEKTGRNYLALVHVACIMLWLI
jgi:transposase